MITITFNRKKIEIDRHKTLQQLLDEKNISEAAVWVNGIQVLSREYKKKIFHNADDVKVIRMIGGG